MSIFGMVLINEKELNNLKSLNYENLLVENLQKEKRRLLSKIEKYHKDPCSLIRGRRYEKDIIDEMRQILYVCEK
jgi:hypothetical protein